MSGLPRIGAASAARLAAARDALDQVAQRDLPEADPLLRTARERVEDTSVTISVVGQVKAGKSSLINALTGTVGLLPTEVNPWTAVITNLHFGHPGHQPGSAVFRFFSKEEWDRMLDGGSESRRLAEEYLPGFKSEILAGQIREMQDRAKARLGDLFHLLLGKDHRFASVTPDILERYVSAGYGGGTAGDPNAGKFSAITKSAEVYLAPGPFQLPVTVSDTPGINDPFLVRDEITTSSFRQADVFVVTLSAHQTLNPADIALLRLLSHHGGRRVVIFVNRIDELDDPGRTVPELIESLKARLAREFGGSMHEVIAGSARWGALAQAGKEALAAASEPASLACARAMGVEDGTPPREVLLRVSGMARLAEVLGEAIHAARVAPDLTDALSQARDGLAYLGEALEDRLKRETGAVAASDDLRLLAQQERLAIETRLSSLNQLDAELPRIVADGRDHLRETCSEATKAAMLAIRDAVDRFVDDQLVAFRAALVADGNAESWSFDTAAVEERAQRHVSENYETGRGDLDEVLRSYAIRLNGLLAPVIGTLPIDRLLDGLPNFRIMPGFRARSNLVEVELTRERGWRFWRSRVMAEDEAVERIAKVIRAELHPQLAELQKAISRALAGRNAAALDRLDGLLGRAHDLIAREKADLRTDALALSGEIDAEAAARLRALRAQRADALRDRIAVFAGARHLLEAQIRPARSGDTLRVAFQRPASA